LSLPWLPNGCSFIEGHVLEAFPNVERVRFPETVCSLIRAARKPVGPA
jgi:hypothetical protein